MGTATALAVHSYATSNYELLAQSALQIVVWMLFALFGADYW